MKKLPLFLIAASLCILLTACATTRSRIVFTPSINDRTAAVIEVAETIRSKTDVPEDPPAVTAPKYFEIVAARTTDTSTSVITTTTEATTKPEETTTATTKTTTAKTSETTTAKNVPITPVTQATSATTKAPTKKQYTVTFVDTDGTTTISVQKIDAGKSAIEPAVPTRRNGMIFIGWDKEFTNVQSNLTVKVLYRKEWLTVRFFDIDGSLLKEEEVLYGEDATAPSISDKGEYLFDGWNASFENVHKDIDVYAKYYIPPTRTYTTLPDAFAILPVKKNVAQIPANMYYRKQYNGVCTLGKTDYSGNIIYGSFSDTLDISGFGFTTFEGIIALKAQSSSNTNQYDLHFFVLVDGVQVYTARLTRTGSFRKFEVDLTDAKTLTIRIEPYINNKLHYMPSDNPEFIGGLIDAVLYEN